MSDLPDKECGLGTVNVAVGRSHYLSTLPFLLLPTPGMKLVNCPRAAPCTVLLATQW